ncbi:esterase [Frankia sp. R43]|uniref:alpha/beta hydrolase n=1 Tax=Frankia sp. R43 TaxID=269536 RepID=UPI0006CA4888|nr:alpha/beta hydrolase-fold protein [Frankia sp. R43]KPM51822.1 esterase [Frankia sp. R43]
MGSVVIISGWFLSALVALAVICWAGCALLAVRRRGRAGPIAAGCLAFLLTVAAAADLVNAHYGYLPRLDDVLGVKSWPTASADAALAPGSGRRYPDGVVIELPITGTHSGFGTRDAMIYLPPQYFTEPRARFPVVYLLHGSPGVPTDWFRGGEAAQIGADAAAGRSPGRGPQPAILVAPRVSRGWLDDSECVDGATEHVETYVIQDVIPTIDARLRSIPARADRVLAGMSAGGFCALNLGLRHRDLVATIIDLSGLTRPTYDAGTAKLFGPRPDLAQVVAANTPARYASTLPPNPPMRVWLDCGRADHEPLDDIREMARVLSGRRGFTVTLRLRPGGHDFGVWRPALREALRWAL